MREIKLRNCLCMCTWFGGGGLKRVPRIQLAHMLPLLLDLLHPHIPPVVSEVHWQTKGHFDLLPGRRWKHIVDPEALAYTLEDANTQVKREKHLNLGCIWHKNKLDSQKFWTSTTRHLKDKKKVICLYKTCILVFLQNEGNFFFYWKPLFPSPFS